MKKYYVYLDESGDFKSDEVQEKWKNPSMVGGFFWDQKSEKNRKKELIHKIDHIKQGENHATELHGKEKGEKVFSMLHGIKKGVPEVQFVVFQNDIKKKLVDSTNTYLTVLTEGLIQLMKQLVMDNDPVELHVVAGFRKDTTQVVTSSNTEGYISLEQYKTRLDEKLAVEKAKLKNDCFQHCSIYIELSDDKRDSLLILCDYICNFWYTRNTRTFKTQKEWNGQRDTIRNILGTYYESRYCFRLFNTEENEHVLRMVQDGCYADALFESCAEMLSKDNCELIYNNFVQLKPKQIHRQLENFSEYIGDLLVFRQSEQLIDKVLKNAEKLYVFIQENSGNKYEYLKFYLDIQLYLLAWLNNQNKIKEMEGIFEKIKPDIAKYTIQNLDMDYLIIYYIRWAVYLQENKRYEESRKICEDLEILLGLVEETIRNNDFLDLQDHIRSEQLGKVLGTKLQAQIALCYNHKESYEAACETSDRAIEQFTYQDDKVRQYQYRAELEAVCGHQEKALEWMEKSFGEVNWKQYLTDNKRSIYDIYNLLYIAALTKNVCQQKSIEIAKKCKEHESIITASDSLKQICYLYMGFVFYGDNNLDGTGRKILKKVADKGAEQGLPESLAAQEVLEGNQGLDLLFEDLSSNV